MSVVMMMGPLKKQRLDTWAYNRCRKPCGDSKTCSTKSLRAASQIIVEKFNAKFTIDPPLTTSDFVILVEQRFMIYAKRQNLHKVSFINSTYFQYWNYYVKYITVNKFVDTK